MKELQTSSVTLIGAGSETSAAALTATTYFLLTHPSQFQELKNEIRTTFPNESNITMVSVNNLTYLAAVLEESMRLFPPGGGIGPRITTSDSTICDRLIPAGTAVGVSQYAANHNPLNFRDPDNFVPERWLGDPKYKNDNPAVFQPFSYGPRNCIGRS